MLKFILYILVKQVFSDMDFLGWYTTGDAPTESDIHVHKQVNVLYVRTYHKKLHVHTSLM